MNSVLKCLTLLMGALVFSSCIKDELPNAECDILEANVSVEHPESYFYQSGDDRLKVLYSEREITFTVRPTADLSALAPHFVITPGAKISPASGSTQDFSQGAVTYTVTSEDGQWQKTYRVAFAPRSTDVRQDVRYSFEHYRKDESGKYYEWYEVDEDGAEDKLWASGNSGFSMSMGSAAADDYPTTVFEEGYNGKGVKLTTRSTGWLGALVGRPIAAGNLFIGSFDVSQALTNTLATTRFGAKVNGTPLRFSGYYKYSPGETFTNQRGQTVADVQDRGTIYAVFYRNQDQEGNDFALDGTNAQTSTQILGYARLGEVEEVSEWTHFDLPFTYVGVVDEAVLANYGYSLAIVATSSVRGAEFSGAIGSTLWIDEFNVLFNRTK